MPKFEAGMESMLDTFIFETSDLLEKLDNILIDTEQEGEMSPDQINEIFRTMHTIKGSAAMMGLQNMSVLAHAVEDLFYIIRDNPDIKVDKPRLYDLLFTSSDCLKGEIENIQDEDIPLTDFTELMNKIHALADEMKGVSTIEKADKVEKSLPENLFPEDEAKEIVTFKVVYDEKCMMPSARGMVLLRGLGNISEVCKTFPADLDDDNADDEIKSSGLFIKLISDDNEKVLEHLKSGMNVVSAEIVPKPEKKPAQVIQEAVSEKKPAKKAGEKHEQSIISVKLDKLDKLLDLVAEIVITESMVTASPDLKTFSGNLERFNKSSRELKKLTDELQDVVMSIRMVPVSSVFQKMNRVVRDMNSKLGKNCQLVFEGEDTEVDKSIVDILGDPLMHIVRNAVDHGIESPEERAEKGKTERPTVTLSAGYKSGEVVIECRDNGAGMNTAKLLAKAKKNGLLTKPENEYTDKEIINFITSAGFSTNEQITEYSGRGVGMDVVMKNLQKVGGKLEVDSVWGEGSVFTIKIPLSLSIIDVLSVRVGESSISLPINAVHEAFRCDDDGYILDPDGNEFIMLRNKLYPLIRLSEHFGIKPDITEPQKAMMIYVKAEDKSAVIMADEIIIDQQVVVKPFSPLLSAFQLKDAGLAGCSILGDGSITLIADMPALLGGYV
ncbi:MAG: chemotaxis protein CheW [Hominimerdicola sp.]